MVGATAYDASVVHFDASRFEAFARNEKFTFEREHEQELIRIDLSVRACRTLTGLENTQSDQAVGRIGHAEFAAADVGVRFLLPDRIGRYVAHETLAAEASFRSKVR